MWHQVNCRLKVHYKKNWVHTPTTFTKTQLKYIFCISLYVSHKLKEDALFYWQFKTKWEELTVCIFFQLCYQGNVWFISSATSISNLPSPYYLLPDVMRFGKKIFPNCSKGVRVVGRSEFTDDPILDLESTQLHTWVFSIFLYCHITIPFLDILGLSLYWLLDGYLDMCVIQKRTL